MSLRTITFHLDGTVTIGPVKKGGACQIISRNRDFTPREIADITHPPAVRRKIIRLALLSGQIRRAK